MDENEYNPIEADVKCHTVGCENIDISIRVRVDANNPHVICGPCGQDITDIEFIDSV